MHAIFWERCLTGINKKAEGKAAYDEPVETMSVILHIHNSGDVWGRGDDDDRERRHGADPGGRNGCGSGAKRDSASLESAIPSGAVYRISGSSAGMGTAGFAGRGEWY